MGNSVGDVSSPRNEEGGRKEPRQHRAFPSSQPHLQAQSIPCIPNLESGFPTPAGKPARLGSHSTSTLELLGG